MRGVKKIRLDTRIYEDETAVYANEAPTRGRARRGTPIIRARSRCATLRVYAKRSGVLHWELSDKNADTREIEGKYFNPLELLFNDLKQHYIRPNFPKNGQSLSKSKVASLVRGYVDERASDALPGFFKARANGQDAIEKKIL